MTEQQKENTTETSPEIKCDTQTDGHVAEHVSDEEILNKVSTLLENSKAAEAEEYLQELSKLQNLSANVCLKVSSKLREKYGDDMKALEKDLGEIA